MHGKVIWWHEDINTLLLPLIIHFFPENSLDDAPFTAATDGDNIFGVETPVYYYIVGEWVLLVSIPIACSSVYP